MTLNPLAVILLLAFVLHAVAFWDAPRQWRRARRDAELTKSRLYRAANAGILLILSFAATAEIVLRRRPGFHPEGAGWELVAWLAAGLGVAGLALAAWAKVTLGPWFAPTAARFPGQPVVRSGPYRWFHHPMYLGWWVFLASLAWALNSLGVAVTSLLVAPLLILLGRHERRFLAQTVPPGAAHDGSHR